jgi:hypothetical protein
VIIGQTGRLLDGAALALCGFGLHRWTIEGLRRICARCQRVEVLSRDEHGDLVERMVLPGGAPLLRWAALAVTGWGFALILLVMLSLAWGQSERTDGITSTLYFGGIHWDMKANLQEQVGPGPNYFSHENVFVDDGGRLHLKIDRIGGRWTTAEVAAVEPFGYGRYAITLGSLPSSLPDGVVLGFFTFDDAPEQFHREIDIELHTVRRDGREYPGPFTVQPWDQAGQSRPVGVAPKEGYVYGFDWSPARIEFFVLNGEQSVLDTWTYTGSVPTPGRATVRLNLWLVQGMAPKDLQPLEVVVEQFHLDE